MGWGTRSAGILLGCLLAPLTQAQVDLEPFLKKNELQSLKISPTGAYYAMTVPLEDQTVLAVVRRADRQVYVRTEGHGFYTEANQRTYYTRLLDFLSRHLGGAKAK